jgi:hypothetical protein
MNEDVKQQDYHLPMIEEGGNNWLATKGKVMQLSNKLKKCSN